MSRLPRMVLPGIPHHVTQRGNRREQTFFEDGDYALYLDLLAEGAERAGVEIWSYCLMPNHVHIVAVPRDGDGLSRAFRHVHRHYTGYVNARLRVTGHLWQGRFSSVAMDEAHLHAALRYGALNPVRAGMVERPEGRARVAGRDGGKDRHGPDPRQARPEAKGEIRGFRTCHGNTRNPGAVKIFETNRMQYRGK